ncbi:MAG TPA: UDP-N-acetylmuramate--L-alanine ligase [Solirubrobacteraceae bacterium]|jgi:UDP-N-acetylmuramate--alanine ligase|nr:UDP-N-acetylmuramate--L-alanine ligase [Solirubrobacteraceae bacterium]
MSAPGAAAGAPRPWAGRRLHLVGIGGAGMSAYARAAHALGASVTGSDVAASPYLEALAADGVVVEVAVGHRAENVPAGDDVEVYHSSAVPAGNPELESARERGLPERGRAELLGELSSLRRTIAVAGSHGKTTTSAMLVHALRAAEMDPGWLVGGAVGGGLGNAHWGEGDWLVVEADESDRSLLSLDVEVAVLTNAELDHHASYASIEEVRAVFAQFLAHARVAVVWDRPELLALAAGSGPETVLPYDAAGVRLLDGGSEQDFGGVTVRLRVPGAHNALNAAGALTAARAAGADVEKAADGLARFEGAGRRFQRLGVTSSGASVYDDYAHHPTEVAATLAAARTLPHRRLIAVFQPHLYSRTAMLAREFGLALGEADTVAVLDVYPARERAEDHPGVSGLMIAEAAADAARGRTVCWLPRMDDAARALPHLINEGDLCVLMGAGDIDALGRRLVA